jgi:hypothetical protein
MKRTLLIVLISFGALTCSATDDFNVFADKKDSCLKAIEEDTAFLDFNDSVLLVENEEKLDSLLVEYVLETAQELQQERETHSVKTYTILTLIVSLITLSIINSHIKKKNG